MGLRATLLRDLQVQARIVGNNSTAALLFSDARAAEEILGGLSASPSVQSANITVGTMPLAQFRRNGAPVPELPPSETGESLHDYGMDYVEVQEPIKVDGKLAGSVSIRASLLPLYRRALAFAGFTASAKEPSVAMAGHCDAGFLCTGVATGAAHACRGGAGGAEPARAGAYRSGHLPAEPECV
jgi:hypothetical protein